MATSKLLELCEPLFQAVCRLNRASRKGSSPSYPATRKEIEAIFVQMNAEAAVDSVLEQQFKRVELPLLFFVDSMISESSLKFAAQWDRDRMAYKRQELAGDQKFFDLLDATLNDKEEGVTAQNDAKEERLAVFYTCLGLGFSGFDKLQAENVAKMMVELSPFVRKYVDTDESALITPDTYEHTSTVNLPLPVSASLVPLLIIILGLFLLVGWLNLATFRGKSEAMAKALASIAAQAPPKH